MKLTVSSNLPGVTSAFEAAVEGVKRFDRSRTADGRVVGLWDGHGMRRSFGRDWRASRAAMFRSQGTSAGTPWPDYTASESQYAAIKASLFGRPVGRASGDLNRWERGRERLLPSMVRESHSEYVQRGGRTTATFGTSVPYAARLHSGIGQAPRHLGGATPPPRPLLGIGRDLRRSWRLTLTEFASQHTSAIGRYVDKAEMVRSRGGRR